MSFYQIPFQFSFSTLLAGIYGKATNNANNALTLFTLNKNSYLKECDG